MRWSCRCSYAHPRHRPGQSLKEGDGTGSQLRGLPDLLPRTFQQVQSMVGTEEDVAKLADARRRRDHGLLTAATEVGLDQARRELEVGYPFPHQGNLRGPCLADAATAAARQIQGQRELLCGCCCNYRPHRLRTGAAGLGQVEGVVVCNSRRKIILRLA
jgi:hypothetical protein